MTTHADSAAVADSSLPAQTYRRRVIVATSIGNALEWFDFVVYGFLAVTMAKLFFPPGNEFVSLLLTFAIFGVPFVARPIGAIVMGNYADRRGRRAALTLSIALMTLATAAIAVVPTYEVIGFWAPVIVLAARLVQGFSVGGEFGAAVAFMVEQDPRRRAFLASWHYASQSATGVLATAFGIGLNNLLTPAQIEGWGWRIPFLFGLLIGPVGYYMRRRLDETPRFMTDARSAQPLREVFARFSPQLAVCCGLIVVSSVTVYMSLFLPTFAIRQLGLSPSVAYLGSFTASTLQMLLIPFVGWLADRHGQTRFLLAASLLMAILAYPLFAFMVANPSIGNLLLVQAIFAVLNSIAFGCLGALIAALFPTRVLTSGLSLSNAVVQTLFGGMTPLICLWLIGVTGALTAPSFWMMGAAAITLAATLLLHVGIVRPANETA